MNNKEIDEKNTGETADSVTNGPDKHKKLKYGSMFYVTIVLVVAVVVALNLMVGSIAKSSPLKIDLTTDDRNEISDVTIEALKALDKDVDITVTTSRADFDNLAYERKKWYYENYGVLVDVPFELIPEVLDKYSVYAGQGKGSVRVRYVDMDNDPELINQYKNLYNGTITSRNIIISCGDRIEVIDTDKLNSMIDIDQYASQAANEAKLHFVGESVITSAINNVTDAHPVRTAVVTQMNGAPICDDNNTISAFWTLENTLLSSNGYKCTDVDIISDDISPENYDMLVVFAPSVDFTEDIIKKLSDFLYNDGKYDRSLIYVPDWTKTNFPNIEEFLADWSIKVEDNLIADDEKNVAISSNIVVKVDDSESVGEVPNEKLPMVSPYTREISQITKNNADVVRSVISTYDSAYTVSLDDKNVTKGEKGERTVVMLSKKQDSDNFKTFTSNLLVVGSPFMFDKDIINMNSTYNNATVLINTINTMTGKAAISSIIPNRSLDYVKIVPSEKEATRISVIVTWIIPIIIAAVGVIVLLRRRNK